jgi:hypothetical protein
LIDGWCSKGSCGCSGEGCVCRLNPKAGKQTGLSFTSGCVVSLRNRDCCHFRSLDVVLRPHVEVL